MPLKSPDKVLMASEMFTLPSRLAYFGFFSIFPLMLAFTSVLGFVITDPDDQRKFSDAAADQIPVVGDTIRNTAGELEGSVVAIVVGLVLALWAGLRIVDAMQNSMNDVWDLPRIARPKLVERRLRGVLMLGLIGGGLVGSIAASNVATFADVIPGAGKHKSRTQFGAKYYFGEWRCRHCALNLCNAFIGTSIAASDVERENRCYR